jgi:hypothetical protein
MGKKKKKLNKLFINNKNEDRDRYNPIFSSEEEMTSGVNAYLESIYGKAVSRKQDLPEGYPIPPMSQTPAYTYTQAPSASSSGMPENIHGFIEDNDQSASFMQDMLSRSALAGATPVTDKWAKEATEWASGTRPASNQAEPKTEPVQQEPASYQISEPAAKLKTSPGDFHAEVRDFVMKAETDKFGKSIFVFRDLSGNVVTLPRLTEELTGIKWSYPKNNEKMNEEIWKKILANACLELQAYCGAPKFVIDMDEFMDLTAANGINGYNGENVRVFLYGDYVLIYDIIGYREGNGLNDWKEYIMSAPNMDVVISAAIQSMAILYEKRYIGFEQTSDFILDALAVATDAEDTEVVNYLKANQIEKDNSAYEDITDVAGIGLLDDELSAAFEFISEMSKSDDEDMASVDGNPSAPSDDENAEYNPYDQYPTMTESDLENFASEYKNQNLGYLAPREGGASTNDAPFPGASSAQPVDRTGSETAQSAEEAVQRGASNSMANGTDDGYAGERSTHNVSSEQRTDKNDGETPEAGGTSGIGSVKNAVEEQQKAEKEEGKENFRYQQTSQPVRKEEAQKEVDDEDDSLIIPVTKGPR